MKIYFIGAHSTGKTTLARYVSARYKLPLLSEVARLILAERELSMDSLRVDIDVVNSFQTSIFERQMKEEAGKDSFVSDRSFDNLAYAAQHSRILRDVLNKPETSNYIEGLRGNDSFIFFVRPIKSTMKDDNVRERVEWDELNRIDGMIKFMLEMWDLRYFVVNTPSMQERIRLVESVLGVQKPELSGSKKR
jgi:adenylate kinase family enzyme